MKRILAMAILAATCLGTVAGPYVGADYQFTVPSYTGTLFLTEPQHFGGGNLHAGWRKGAAAAEVGWYLGGGQHMSLSGPTLDTFLFAPFFRSDAEIFATAGLANLALIDHAAAPPFSTAALTWRAGAGLQWRMGDATTARLALRYQDYGFGHRMNGGASLSAGLNFALGPQ